LAKFYQVDPNIFLNKAMSELTRHIIWTNKLIERSNIEATAASEY
jgi:hypothetical protein